MESVFQTIVNMSITASWLVIAVIALRLILKKAPKWLIGIFWGFVAFRLVCPFSIESVLSLIPSSKTIPDDILITDTPQLNTGLPHINNTINSIISESFSPEVGASVNPMQIVAFIAANIWLVGVLTMLAYTAISYISIRLKVREAVHYDGNVYSCDRVESPFVLGIIKPKIYVPSSLNESDLQYVLSHENAHIKRKDHWWKPFGFLLLSVHWFNPLLWLAYILFCRDIEFACDEKVIKQLGAENKKPYSEALINCSTSRKVIIACPLAFGEVGVKERIKSVLHYKKPAFWIILVSVLAMFAVAMFLLTNPPHAKDTSASDENPILSVVYDSISFDIDGDDVTEHCELSGGITYGLFSFRLRVFCDGLIENTFAFTPTEHVKELKFVVKEDKLAISMKSVASDTEYVCDLIYGDVTYIENRETGEKFEGIYSPNIKTYGEYAVKIKGSVIHSPMVSTYKQTDGIVKLESVNDIEAFKKQYVGSTEVRDKFLEYDDAFFEDKSLLVCHWFAVKNPYGEYVCAYKADNVLTVDLVSAFSVLSVFESQLLVVEIDNADIKDCKEFRLDKTFALPSANLTLN